MSTKEMLEGQHRGDTILKRNRRMPTVEESRSKRRTYFWKVDQLYFSSLDLVCNKIYTVVLKIF